MSRRAWQTLTALACGALFGVGLAVAGMTLPRRVIGFLDFGGAWDPSLAFVMAGAVGVHFLALRLIRRRTAPLFAPAFAPPARRDVEPRLLVGSALFGVGWGLAGYCPGPAIASLGSLAPAAFVFVAAASLGILAGKQIEACLGRADAAGSASAIGPREP